MLKLILISFLFLSSAALAADPVQPSEYTIKLTAQELDIVGRGLGTQPYNDVAPLVQKLRAQVVEQQQPVKPAMVPDVEKPK